jgi:hypothetical protein
LNEIGSLIRGTPEVSPDGSKVVAFVGTQLYLRRLVSTAWVPLRGTEGCAQAFWSPDSQSVGFSKQGNLMTMRLPDGAPEPLHSTLRYVRGATWGSRGLVLNASSGLWIGAVGSNRVEQV